MKVRKAKITDAKAICSLVSFYAELDKMLFRSLSDIYENIQAFTIAQVNEEVVGTCALQVVWSDLAEIKSLSVKDKSRSTGIGKGLVQAACQQARELGITRIFALTLEPAFFIKLGFDVVEKDKLPMKVWSDCARCGKQDHCDEIAVMRQL
jgi:amino-acid N-acetyltransferase